MAEIESFEIELRCIIGKSTDLRPFVCDGSPLECEAFIVGFNPANTMSADFWQFWHSGHGFDKAAWFEAYIKDRQRRPLKAGKTRRKAMSNTRRVIEWIVEEAKPVRCLKTNIYAAPTKQQVDLVPEQRTTTAFDYLLKKIQPRLIVCHGKEAARHIQGKCVTGRIITVPHFSRGWSQACARTLGQRIRHECNV